MADSLPDLELNMYYDLLKAFQSSNNFLLENMLEIILSVQLGLNICFCILNVCNNN